MTGYVARISSKSQESNSSIESQKQQLIQNGIEEENCCFCRSGLWR